MSFIRKIYRIRLFLILGVLVYAAYLFTEGAPWFYTIIGPPLYAAYHIKAFLESYVSLTPLLEFMSAEAINDYVFLAPVTLIYFGLMGFILKNLQLERGGIKIISIMAFVLFIGFVHFVAWKAILAYYLTAR